MKRYLLYANALVHLSFTLTLCGLLIQHRGAFLTLTVRRQFNRWHDLLTLHRDPGNVSAAFFRNMTTDVTGCGAPLLPGAVRAAFCDCVDAQQGPYLNGTGGVSQAARDGAVRGLLACMSSPSVWQVWPFWSVHLTSPALFVMATVACFSWMATGQSGFGLKVPLWGLLILVFFVFIVTDPTRNCLWALSTLLTGAAIQWVILPGLQQTAGEVVALGTTFWWCEYLCAPNYVFYATVLYAGRDFAYVVVTFVLAAAAGGLGLRSFWLEHALASGDHAELRRTLQFVSWAGIAGASVGIDMLLGVYYTGDQPLQSGKVMLLLVGLTLLIPLSQWPTMINSTTLAVQAIAATVRNVVLFAVVVRDLTESGL